VHPINRVGLVPELPIMAEVRAGLTLAGILGGGSRCGQAQTWRKDSRGAAELGC
jgi:hypothetical protein